MNRSLRQRDTVNKMLVALNESSWNVFHGAMEKIGVINEEKNEVDLSPLLRFNPDYRVFAATFGSIYAYMWGEGRQGICRKVIEWRSQLPCKFRLNSFATIAARRHPDVKHGILLFLKMAEGRFSDDDFKSDSRKENDIFTRRQIDIDAGIAVIQGHV